MNTPLPSRHHSCDVLVVGGGIQGLWVARHAIAAGLSTILVDRAHCGAGSSGGVLGALMPHMPTSWSAKKQFQLEALVELEGELARLEADSGLGTGYRRCGRVIPIRRHGFLAEAQRRAKASDDAWVVPTRRFRQSVGDAAASWCAVDAAPLGVLADDLSARLDPRRTVRALVAVIQAGGRVESDWPFARFDAKRGTAVSGTGDTITAGHIVLAAGYQAFELACSITGDDLGHGVKGQAAVLAATGFEHAPIIYDDGLYIVPHADGRVAVGSTTEADWRDADATDTRLDALVERARGICPPLEAAPVVSRWAGVRPRSQLRDPIVGRLPGAPAVSLATGGYKISFGIAHRLARWLVDEITGSAHTVDLPETFAVSHHVTAAAARRA